MSKLIFTLFISIVFLHPSFAQITLTGRVLNAEDQTPLPYVNLGIAGQNTGTITDRNGQFELEIPDSLANSQLLASYVGFETEEITLTQSRQLEIKLNPQPQLLKAVAVQADHLKTTKEGVRTFTPFVNAYTKGSKDDILEVGQRIKLNDQRLYIEQVNFYLFGCNADSISFRVNFYEAKDGEPGELLNRQAIYHAQKKEKGWLKVDVKEFGIQSEGDFFVCLEFLPTQQIEEEIKVYFGANLLRRGAFYRDSSQGQWEELTAGFTLNIEGHYEKL